MRSWICLLVSCFMVHTALPAVELHAAIEQVQPFQTYDGCWDLDSGAWFWLDDGSQWMRTYWSGPIYYLYPGQRVVFVPMTYEEHYLYQLWEYPHYVPYWIVLDSQNVGIAYSVS